MDFTSDSKADTRENLAHLPVRGPQFTARAILVADRLDLRAVAELGKQHLATQPLVVPIEGGGLAALFRYGAIVLFDVSPEAEHALLEKVEPAVEQPVPKREIEEFTICISDSGQEGVDGHNVTLVRLDVQRLQLVAVALAKSVVLANYEADIIDSFDRIEPLARHLDRRPWGVWSDRELLRHIGSALLSEHELVSRVEVTDKPELLWERPDLEPLYLRLDEELEIHDRHAVLERKLELIDRTARTVLELLQAERTLRVEWYIVILIVVEIVLLAYELFFRG